MGYSTSGNVAGRSEPLQHPQSWFWQRLIEQEKAFYNQYDQANPVINYPEMTVKKVLTEGWMLGPF